MSGKKGRSGRKSNAEVARARELFRSVIPEARRKKIIRNLAQQALETKGRRAMEAFRVLAPYLFGVPTEKNSGEENVEPFNFIEYVMPADKESD